MIMYPIEYHTKFTQKKNPTSELVLMWLKVRYSLYCQSDYRSRKTSITVLEFWVRSKFLQSNELNLWWWGASRKVTNDGNEDSVERDCYLRSKFSPNLKHNIQNIRNKWLLLIKCRIILGNRNLNAHSFR